MSLGYSTTDTGNGGGKDGHVSSTRAILPARLEGWLRWMPTYITGDLDLEGLLPAAVCRSK